MVIQSPRRTRSLAIPAPPVLFSSLAKRSSAPAWYRDRCFDNLTQLEYCNDKHEDQVDDSFICEDCASVGAKELEVECHDIKEDEVESDNVEMNDFTNAKELQSPASAWYRGDQCIDSHGDSIAEDVCFDEPTQLEQSDDEFLWDGNHDFASHAEEETRCYDDEQDVNAEDYYHLFYGDEEETFCYDYQEDVNAEDCSYY